MKKIFIYYSLTGNGDMIANYLKDKGYDIRKVETQEPLPKNYILRILSGGYKAMINYEDKLINFDNDIATYDEIIIGTPIWNDRISSPINAVLKELDLSGKTIKFILYSGKARTKKAKSFINKKYNQAEIINLKEPQKNNNEIRKIEIITKDVNTI